jgi:hypothetical protein
LVSRNLAEYVRNKLYHHISKDIDPRKIIYTNSEVPQICSGYSKLMVAVANALGYSARVIWTNGHTVSEIYFPNKGWVLIDTNGNLIFKNKYAEFLSLIDVVDNFNESIPIRLSKETGNDHDYIKENKTKVYDSNDIIVIIKGDKVLDFDDNTRNPKTVLKYILWGEPIAQGIQYIGNNRQRIGNSRTLLLLILSINFFIVLYISISIKKHN